MLVLRGATLADGRLVDVTIDEATIVSVTPSASADASDRESDRRRSGEHPIETIDLDGFLLLPSFVEPHAHLDKALTAELVPNPQGDLLGAIHAWFAFVPSVTVEAVVERATAAALELVASGTTAIRTHVNVHPGIELRAIEAMLAVRDRLCSVVDIQLVALVGVVVGDGDEPRTMRALLRDAVERDRDIIVGGCPHLDDDIELATDIGLELAGELGRPIDLHTDETLDQTRLGLPYLARRVAASGFPHAVVASHCVSLGVQPPDAQTAVAEQVAAAGVAVVTLPQTNLYLQGRESPTSPPRGLTALRPLLKAGVTLAGGADNVRDPFNLMGRSDPLETAALLVMAGHLTPTEALAAVTSGARGAIGLVPVEIAPGFPADLVAIRATSLIDAMARADQERRVWKAGRLVAATGVERTFHI